VALTADKWFDLVTVSNTDRNFNPGGPAKTMHSSLLASFLSFFFTFFWLIRTVDNINLLTQTDGKRRRAKSPSEVPGSWARPGVAYFWDQVPDRRPFGRWPDLAECSAWIMRAHSSINFHSFRHSPNFSLFAVRVPVLVPKPKAEKIHTSREQCSSDHVLDHFLIVLAVGGPPSPFCGFRNSVCVSVSYIYKYDVLCAKCKR